MMESTYRFPLGTLAASPMNVLTSFIPQQATFRRSGQGEGGTGPSCFKIFSNFFKENKMKLDTIYSPLPLTLKVNKAIA